MDFVYLEEAADIVLWIVKYATFKLFDLGILLSSVIYFVECLKLNELKHL
jgi:hypothetical protein